MTKEIDLMDIKGFKVGQAEDPVGITGCTVMLFDQPAPAGVDVRGGGPASRETPLLNPVAQCDGLNAILLSGGSAFGLDAAGGVMRYLEERGIGFDVGVTKVPLVCQSDIFDLAIGDFMARPDQEMAYRACQNAGYQKVEEGNHGVGMGCCVGSYRGPQFGMKGGLGTYAIDVEGIQVGAIVAVNAMGDIYDIDTNQKLAGVRNPDGSLLCDETQYFADAYHFMKMTQEMNHKNTTIGIVVTNAKLDKTALNKVASMAHNGYGRAIHPVHTMADGDSIYAASVGEMTADINLIGPMAAYVMGKAIGRAVLAADSIGGKTAAKDLK